MTIVISDRYLYSTGSEQPFGHQALLSWKTIFPENWGGMAQAPYYAFYSCYYGIPPPQIVRHEAPRWEPDPLDHLKSPTIDKHPFAGSSSLKGSGSVGCASPRQPRTWQGGGAAGGRTDPGAELVTPRAIQLS